MRIITIHAQAETIMPSATGYSEVRDPHQDRPDGPPAFAGGNGGRAVTGRHGSGARRQGPDTRSRSCAPGSMGDIVQAVVVVMVLLKLLLFGL
jgi:hypothetical protein